MMICYGFLASISIYYGLVERQSLFVTFVSFHVVVCLVVPLFHGYWEGYLTEHWRNAWGDDLFHQAEGLFFGFLTGTVLFLAILIGSWLLLTTEVNALWIRRVLMHWGLTSDWIGLFVLYITVINSLLEELLWRGFVLERLLPSMSRVRAVLLSSFFYSLYHLILASILFGVKWGLIITGLVFIVGNIWGWLKLHYHGVYATWVSHLLADLGLMVVLVTFVF